MEDPVVAAVEKVLPPGLPQDVRDELRQELVLAVLSGTVLPGSLSRVVSKFIKGAFGAARPPVHERSLDEPLRSGDAGEGVTLGELVPAPGPKGAPSITLFPSRVDLEPVDLPPPLNKRSGKPLKGCWLRCHQCQTPKFVPPSALADWKYCRMECRIVGGWHGPSKPHLARQCLFCGAAFDLTPAKAKRYPGKYCSLACAQHARKGTKRRQIAVGGPCERCRRPVPVFVNRKAGTRYCSEKCRTGAFHDRATKQRLCHWCGKPSLADYKNACAEHAGWERKNNRRLSVARRQRLKAAGFCITCGIQKANTGSQLCKACGGRAREKGRKSRLQKRRAELRQIRQDGFITVAEAAAQHLYVHPKYVNTLIAKGQLAPHRLWGKGFWLKKADVIALAKARFDESESPQAR